MNMDKVCKVLGYSGVSLALLGWGYLSAMRKERTDSDLITNGKEIGILRYCKMVLNDSLDSLVDFLKH